MRNKVEVIKQWITKTKEEVKEGERVREIIGEFFETFGFMPDVAEWINEGVERVLQATALQTEQEIGKEFILGQRIEKIKFSLIEDRLYGSDETNWKYSCYSSGPYTCYKWSRVLKGFKAKVEIFVK